MLMLKEKNHKVNKSLQKEDELHDLAFSEAQIKLDIAAMLKEEARLKLEEAEYRKEEARLRMIFFTYKLEKLREGLVGHVLEDEKWFIA